MKRVLVCGGRDYDDETHLFAVLDELHKRIGDFIVIHGDNKKGADRMARDWADSRCLPQMKFPAQWKKQGRAAGPIRNRRMLKESQPDMALAFPDPKSVGTWDMVDLLDEAGIEVEVH